MISFRYCISTLFSISLCYFSETAQCNPIKVERIQQSSKDLIKKYLLPKNSPLKKELKKLFIDPNMFISEETFRKSGFGVKHGHRSLMLGFHHTIPNYIIKKFIDQISPKKQLINYLNRLRGAEIIQKYIIDHQFQHLVVPKKWLYRLPKGFSESSDRTYVLIVENMNILDGGDHPEGAAAKAYYNMNREQLTELATLLFDVGGCDAFPRNQPFNRSGKIAFIDTEHVGKKKFINHFLIHTIPSLNPEMQSYGITLWNMLKQSPKKQESISKE